MAGVVVVAAGVGVVVRMGRMLTGCRGGSGTLRWPPAFRGRGSEVSRAEVDSPVASGRGGRE